MDFFNVTLGGAVSSTSRFVALWWEARTVPPDHEVRLASVLQGLPDKPGLYAITGKQDAHIGDGVLYIGKADRLNDRPLASAEGHLLEVHDNRDLKMYSDVWDVTIRWAHLDAHLLLAVEGIMIMSHVPPFNSQQVSELRRRQGPELANHDLVIMNAGRKGPLLPIVAGAYQAPWRDSKGRPMEPVK